MGFANRMILRVSVLAFSVAMVVGCGGGGGGGGGTSSGSSSSSSSNSSSSTSGGSFDYQAMFTNLADNIFIPNYEAAKNSAETFSADGGSLDSYCGSIGEPTESASLDSAKDDWKALMHQWQRAEVHTVGPASDNASFLRSRIYSNDSFPLDTCRVDRGVVLAADEGFDISGRVFNSRGLAALEYLLFADSLAHTCVSSNPQTDTWNARTEQERKQMRCAYSKLLASDISDAAADIYNAWVPSGSDYRATFVESGDDASILQLITDAIFYIEKNTKDIKLGIPTGIKVDCAELACPADTESPYSETSLENIQTNVESFADIFTGLSGSSFDDVISRSEMPEVSAEFTDLFSDISDLIDAMLVGNQTVLEQTQAILDSGDHADCTNSNANPDTVQTIEVCALHGLLKLNSDKLRTDFITIVGVDLPESSQGDAD